MRLRGEHVRMLRLAIVMAWGVTVQQNAVAREPAGPAPCRSTRQTPRTVRGDFDTLLVSWATPLSQTFAGPTKNWNRSRNWA